MRLALGLIAGALPTLAALDVPGAGEAPVPGPLPTAWFAWQNDGFGAAFGLDSDDHRTNGFSAGATWKGFVLGIDSSMLTNRYPEGGGTRVDELTTSLGYESSAGWARARVGGGARATGDLGGDLLQYRTHRFLAQERFTLSYERESLTWDPLLYGRFGLEVPVCSVVRLEPRAVVLATASGQLQAQAGARVVALGPGGAWWAGADHHWRSGDTPTTTQAVVAKAEEGTWLAAGIAVDLPPWQLGFSLGRNLDNDEQQGAFHVGATPGLSTADAGSWRGEFGAMLASTGESGRGQEFRLLRGFAAVPWLEAVVDVRDWASATEDPQHLSARALSIGGGARAAYRPFAVGWTPVLALDAGLAWHGARIRAHGTARVDGGSLVEERTALVHGGPAAGIGYRSARGASGEALMALDVRRPFERRTVRVSPGDGTGSYDYALTESEVVPVLRIAITIAW